MTSARLWRRLPGVGRGRPAGWRFSIAVVLGAWCGATQAAAAQERASSAAPHRLKRGIPAESTVVIVPSRSYRAGALHRFLLGANYREQWATSIRVPVLDIGRVDGGLKATKVGGGRQTRSLRLENPVGREYVFRPVYKDRLVLPDEWTGTLIDDIFNDAMSASHPTGVVAAAPLLAAARVLHPTPMLAVMGDSPRLGEWREEFAGRLGTIEEFPSVPDDAPGFARAVDIIETEDLLERLHRDPRERIDARMLLRARLLDFVLGDNDRHHGQWDWARLRPDGPWLPIARDRDKVFVSHGGVLSRLARVAAPYLVTFDHAYPDLVGFTGRVMHFDRRLLQGLDRAVWDSIAAALVRTISDSVIDAGLARMPQAYAERNRELRAKLRARRDHLPQLAARYYRLLYAEADLHGTDMSEEATLVRAPDGSVEVTLAPRGAAPVLRRRFEPEVTREIRLYLHGGDDRAIIRGEASRSIPIRVIGGNGTNTIIDSSTVAGRRQLTRTYDAGFTSDVHYGADTLFDRRPWQIVDGEMVPPVQDFGSRITPLVGLDVEYSLGAVPRIGFSRYRYGFRHVPYAHMVAADVAFSTALAGFELGVAYDNRFESAPWHVLGTARVSQLRVGEFHGFGNNTAEQPRDRSQVRQTEWTMHPALGLSIGTTTDLTVGPVLEYVTTNRAADRVVAQLHPYGFPHFGQAGLRLELHHTSRATAPHAGGDLIEDLKPGGDRQAGVEAELTGAWYPSLWDAAEPYGHVGAVIRTYVPLERLRGSIVALRVGGRKVFGAFPYFEAAFLGGSESLRTVRRQRYAGDASLYGSAELRVPLADVKVVLPLDLGALAFVDAGRVFSDGASPGGWHTGLGAGFWVGLVDPSASVTVTFTDRPDRRLLLGTGFAF